MVLAKIFLLFLKRLVTFLLLGGWEAFFCVGRGDFGGCSCCGDCGCGGGGGGGCCGGGGG